MAVYYLCPEIDHPCGGVKVIYRHVDILQAHGIPAFVLHQKRGFRCTWFENSTPIAYTRHPVDSLRFRLRRKLRQNSRPNDPIPVPITGGSGPAITGDDILVVTENSGPDIANVFPGLPKVILNQNGFLTFVGYSFHQQRLISPYKDESVKAVLVNSEHCSDYVSYAFPQAKIFRFFLSIEPNLFYFQQNKKKNICFSRIKNTPEAMQVANMLKFRGALDDFTITPFVNISHSEVARLLRESLIFLSFGNREGFGLPAAEAMACGCITIGYHGWGGKEFFNPTFSFPIDDGDLIGFAKSVEESIRAYNIDSSYFLVQREKAAHFVSSVYSPRKEEETLISIWDNILS